MHNRVAHSRSVLSQGAAENSVKRYGTANCKSSQRSTLLHCVPQVSLQQAYPRRGIHQDSGGSPSQDLRHQRWATHSVELGKTTILRPGRIVGWIGSTGYRLTLAVDAA